MKKNEELIREKKDTLETIADSDLPAEWIAQELLSVIEEEPEQQETEQQQQKEPEGSLFAY
jgi:hypothetical protein